MLDDIVGSFEFVNGASPSGGQAHMFVSAKDGFAINLPGDWRVESETGLRYVFSQSEGLGSMGVRVGTGAEPATMCVGAAPAPGR